MFGSQEGKFIINHYFNKWKNELGAKGSAFLKAAQKKDLLVHEEADKKSVCYIDTEGLIYFFLKDDYQKWYPGRQRFFLKKIKDLLSNTFIERMIKNFENEVIGLSDENQTILNIFLNSKGSEKKNLLIEKIKKL